MVVAAWLLLALGFGWMQPKLQQETETDPAAFIPDGVESTRVTELIEERFPSADVIPAIVLYEREGGLRPADLARVEDDAAAIGRRLALREQVVSPGRAPSGARPVSPDGSAAIVTVPLPGDALEAVDAAVGEIRAIAAAGRGGGLATHVTGPAALSVDATGVFRDIDVTLLIATTALIIVLLVAIYRSPLIALVPLAMVAVAYAVAAGIVYLLVAGAGLAINPQAAGILIILMFGAGTDYSLLVIARLREELRRERDHHAAVAAALRGTAGALLASGGTVAAAMLVLVLGDLRSTATQGPVLAIGITVVLVAGLTLLPALLAIAGRRAFWPAAPEVGDGDGRGMRLWNGLAAGVARRPVAVLAVTLLALGAGAAGNLVSTGGLSFSTGFRDAPPSVEGQRALERAFPAGEVAPADVLVEAPPGRLRAAAAEAAGALERLPLVASAEPVEEDPGGTTARLRVALDADPYGDEAIGAVDDLRDAARAAVAPLGGTALVGGPTAEEADQRATARRDFWVIAPVALALIFLILVLLLRSIAAPLYLALSQALSFATTLGVSLLMFVYVFDAPGSDAGLPLFVFIFTVALGVDYTIFLITRVREETRRRGTREAVPLALARTGGVITSAGVILAGTFLVLTILPLEQLFQLGIAVAVGVLVDTFVVRTLLVPAAALLLGRANWWPWWSDPDREAEAAADHRSGPPTPATGGD